MVQPQIFDPSTVTSDQMAGLVNIPGQSLTATNTEGQLQASQALNPNPNIPAYKAAPTSPFYVPPPPTEPDYSSLMASTNTAQTAVNATDQALIDATKAYGGQDAERATLEGSTGVTADTAGLRDLTAQLTSLNNGANAAKIKAEGQPIEQGSIDGQQRQIEHERTIKALGISASMAAMQGNIQTANDKIDAMLKLKYGAIKTNIEVLNLQSDRNYKNLTAAQKVQADALQYQRDIKLKQVGVQEAKQKSWETDKNQALANGAPLKVVQRAEALRVAGQEDAARALLANYTGTKGNQVIGYDSAGNPIYSHAPKAPTSIGSQTLTKEQKVALKATGINDDVSNAITTDLLKGASLESVRQDLIKLKLDPKILDTYDNIVGIKGLLDGSRTQFKSSGSTKLF